ncbi:elongation factor-2 kinase EFK-1B isoform [Xylaria scruposa]|nr:elongation factor-2 kinase EFK-1B isoform [Xylaria scruposa]
MDSAPTPPFCSPAPGLVKNPSRADIREAREAMLRSAMFDSSSTVSTSLTVKKTSTSTEPPVRTGSATIASPYVCLNPTAGSEPNLSRPASASMAKSASLSRSKASQQDLQASADALLRASEARLTSASMLPTALSSREMLANGLHSTSSASLPPRPPPIQSASLSRSKPGHTISQASEDILRSSLTKATSLPSSSLSRSVSVPHSGSSATLSRRVQSVSLPSHSISRSSQARIQTSADDMLRTSLARDSAPTASTHPYNSLPDSLSLTKKRRSHQSEPLQLPSTMSFTGSSPPSYSPNWRISTTDQKSWVRKFQYEADRERARTPNRATDGLFKEAVSVDLLFLIDCTGSMGMYIAAVKEQVMDIVDDAKRAFLNQTCVRVAVVAYRDHDDNPNVELLDFTPDVGIVKQFVGSLAATGGRDAPEDVLGGIRQAINSSWKQKTRCLIHIGDSPPHGRNLHELSDFADDYPEPGSEPHSLTYEPLIQQLMALKINYVVLRVTSSTDLMVFKFGEIYKNAQAQVKLLQSNRFYKRSQGSSTSGSRESVKSSASAALQFEELELGTAFEALRHLVAISITRSVTRSAGVLSKALSKKRSGTRTAHHVATKPDKYLTAVREEEEEEEDEQSFQVPVENIKPLWDTPGWLDEKLAVKGLCPDMPRHSTDTLRNMMTQDENIKLGFIQLEIQTRSKPFAQGAMRTASYARTSASTDRFVVKAFKKEDRDLAFIAEEMKGQALCKAFAIEFNALLDPEYSLDFVVTAALEPQSRAGACISIEPFIDGNYVKYNSNGAYVNEDLPDDPCNQAAQAFSHFTFERSWGNFLINDLQGVGNMLTDPAIQTKDPERFKLCDPNLNTEGFKFFFASHKCNALCHKLQLKSTGLMLIEGPLEFREEWPGVRSRVYCSNKLCRRILREDASGNDSARKTSQFPGYYWCISCFPQLESKMQQRTCAEAYGARHEFEFSSFFYESQGQAAPLKCPEHVEDDTAGSNIGSVGGGLWARMQATNEKEFVSGR